jgi:hypothetical protein
VKESDGRRSGEEIKEGRKRKKAAEKQLARELEKAGHDLGECRAKPNRKCPYQDVEEEREARCEIATEQFRLLRGKLPVLLRRLKKIKDPRNPKKIKYGVSMLMIYGILMFVFQMSSKREANETMTRPMFMENLKLFVPELEQLPHCDTLMRLLEKTEVDKVEAAQLDLVRSLIRKKKFKRYLVDGRYTVAFDGTSKFSRDWQWDENCLERKVGEEGERRKYSVYVPEASLAFANGLTVPLASEFLSRDDGDPESQKQDCELKAFKRLSLRLKKEFKRLPIMALLDGLYPNGPVFEECRNKNWDFMIVLKDKSLKSVWEEYEGLGKLVTENTLKMKTGRRSQSFRWVNDIYYYCGKGKKHTVHVVVCMEQWKEIDAGTNEPVEKNSKHAWISNVPLNKDNVHPRCNLAARRRWNIENQIQDEKCRGYNYSHCYSYNWNAMKGFHFLMNIGVTINALAEYSEALAEAFVEKGTQGFIRFVRETLGAPWIEKQSAASKLQKNYQLRLI